MCAEQTWTWMTFLSEKLQNRKILAGLETEKYWHHQPQHAFERTKYWQQDCVLDHLEGQQILLCSDELWKGAQVPHNSSCAWMSPQHVIRSYPSLFTKSICFHFAAWRRILEHSWHLNVLENFGSFFLSLFYLFFRIWWPSSVFICNISYRQVWLYYSLRHLHTDVHK